MIRKGMVAGVVFGLASIGLLSGCEFGAKATVRFSQLESVVSSREPLPVPLALAFRVMGKNACEGMKSTVLPGLKAVYREAHFLSCEDDQAIKVVTFRVIADLVYELDDQKPNSEQPFYLGVYVDEKGAELAYYKNTNGIAALVDKIGRENVMVPGGELFPVLSIEFENDSDETRTVEFGESIVDGMPKPGWGVQEQALGVGETLVVQASNVAGRGFVDENYYIAMLRLKPE